MMPTVSASASSVVNESLSGCCRRLAARAAEIGPAHRLHPDLLAVVAEYERVLGDPVLGPAIRTGEQAWPDVAGALLDPLLTAAGSALRTESDLTALIADTVLRARPGSRAAWRLRAQAHEQWGDLEPAIHAHEEYLARVDDDRLGIGAHVGVLRRLQAARTALAQALVEAAENGDPLPDAAADLHDRLRRPIPTPVLDPFVEDFLADLTRLPVAELEQLRDVLDATLACLRAGRLDPPAGARADTGPDAGPVRVLRLGDLRGHLEGRTICLVADPDRLSWAGAPPAGTGGRIDGYDLVARFSSGPVLPEWTGSRTDLLVVRHDTDTGWERPAGLRMVLADDDRDWVRSIRRNLVPGAQDGLVDKELRRPAHQPALVGADRSPRRSSSPFHLIRLLDHLDVNPVIDLVGFGGNPEPGQVFDNDGIDGGFTDAELAWLRGRVRDAGAQRISLR